MAIKRSTKIPSIGGAFISLEDDESGTVIEIKRGLRYGLSLTQEFLQVTITIPDNEMNLISYSNLQIAHTIRKFADYLES